MEYPVVQTADYPSPDRLQYIVEKSEAGVIMYEGWAKPGVATNAKGWEIAKYSVNGFVTLRQFAKGAQFSHAWTVRADLSYE